jgi:hypothetical protein
MSQPKTYNGSPVFSVGFKDFCMCADRKSTGKRLVSTVIESDEIRTHMKESRRGFFVVYEGVMLEMRSQKLPENKEPEKC